MPKIIKSTTYATGEESETVEFIESALSFMPEGRAWRASAQALGDQIGIIYWSGEFCVASFTIALRRNAWLVVDIGESCD
jgi:hypothetical protein